MKQILKKYTNPTLIAASSFVVMSFILGITLSNGLVIFLSWNMLLAILSYFLSILAVYLKQKDVHLIAILVSIFLWVIFFPNTFYILTDFIHFQSYDFFISYPNIYNLNINDWYVFFDIVVGALIGLKLGILSIAQIKSITPKRIKKYEILLIFTLFILSSIGIYLGRFIRLNSWNIFDLSSIFNSIFEHFEFFILFILLFTIIQSLSYLLFKEKGESCT